MFLGRFLHQGITWFRGFGTLSAAMKPVQNPKLNIVSATAHKASRTLQIRWEDGFKGRYPFVWLRDNAPVYPTFYFGERTIARELHIDSLHLDIEPASYSVSEVGNAVEILWPDKTYVSYTSSWLRKRNLDDPKAKQGRRTGLYIDDFTPWNREMIDGEIQNPAVFPRMMEDDGYLAEALLRFVRFGFLRVTDVPRESGQVEKFGRRVGYLQNTHYGPLFTVRQQEKPTNQAYTRKPLPLHTDVPTVESPPEIQILHCVTEANTGGLSQFVDGFQIAELLRKERRDLYDILKNTVLEYIDFGVNDVVAAPYIHVGQWPVISLDKDGRLERVIFNNHMRSWFMDVPVEEYDKVYRALKTFDEYCYEDRNLLELKIMAGDFVMFANNRVLHGRSGYECGGNVATERHLEGGYVHFDSVKSFIRFFCASQHDYPHAVLEPM